MAKAPSPPPPKPRPRGGAARAIADLVPEIGGAAFRRFGFIQSALVCRWAEIVGPKLAALTEPSMLRFPPGKKAGGTLHLTISGAHAPMLQLAQPTIIAAANRFFGYAAVARVKMTAGEVRPAPRPVVPPANLRPVGGELGESLRAIADPELRTVLENMAAGLGNRPTLPRVG